MKIPGLTNYKDVDELKNQVASNSDIIYQLGTLAHLLGFGWCGGTQQRSVGRGFDLKRKGESYELKAHYDSKDPYSGGYWANKRLIIVLSNFQFRIDVKSMNFDEPRLSHLEPSTIGGFTARNESSFEDKITKKFTYQMSETKSHSTSFGFSEGLRFGNSLEVWAEGKIMVPEVAEAGGGVKTTQTTELTLNANQGWEDTSETSYSEEISEEYEAKIPPFSSRRISLIVMNTSSDVRYIVPVWITFDVTFKGFLKWGGNARKDHPKNRPFVEVKFGNDTKSAFEDILDQNGVCGVAKESEWDWDWIRHRQGARLRQCMDFFQSGIETRCSGSYSFTKGKEAQIVARAPVPLAKELRAELDTIGEIGSDMVTGLVSSEHDLTDLLLETDEFQGGRVLSIE